FQPAVLLVDPTPVGPLPLRQRRREVGPPVVPDALRVHDHVEAERIQALGHRVVVVVQAPLRTARRHAGVGVHRVVVADPLVRLLDPRVVLADAAVDHALNAGVGHAAVAGQPAVGALLVLGLAAGRGAVDEAAVVDFAGT